MWHEYNFQALPLRQHFISNDGLFNNEDNNSHDPSLNFLFFLVERILLEEITYCVFNG